MVLLHLSPVNRHSSLMEQESSPSSAARSAARTCEEYGQARRLGQLLAEAGFTICTGGYLGVMEAASRGAHERGGRVLGIVMNQFKSEPNRFLTDKVATRAFLRAAAKLDHALGRLRRVRGGMGTVTELSLVWNKLQTRVIGPRPLVLLGDCWPPVVEAWQQASGRERGGRFGCWTSRRRPRKPSRLSSKSRKESVYELSELRRGC